MTQRQSYNPDEHARRFGLFRVRSPLLTESLLVFFSSAYLDVSVRQVRDYCLHAFSVKGCPIRTSTDLWSFAPPRRFSQLTTSFVASGNQGIHRAPLFRFHILSRRIYAHNDTSKLLIFYPAARHRFHHKNDDTPPLPLLSPTLSMNALLPKPE